MANAANAPACFAPNSCLLRRYGLTLPCLFCFGSCNTIGLKSSPSSELDSVPQESQKVELEVKQLDSDLESSTEADGAQDAILENIVPSKAKKLPKQRVIPMDQREKDIESMLFGSLSSFADFTAEQDEDSQDDEETLSPDHISPYSTDDEEPEQHVLGMKAARDAEV